MKRPVLAALFLLSIFQAAHGENPPIADRAISGDALELQDGRVVRLHGIKSLFSAAQGFLQTHSGGKRITLADETSDRYGRVDAVVTAEDETQSLEAQMLQAGLAFVYPAAGDEARLDDWLAAEKAARAARLGYWATHPDTIADAAEKLYGSYGFVVGTVVKAERVKNKLYLNFGADWRTDFTIAIAAHDLRKFKNADIDLLALAGQAVRVRGWVKRDFGPMITITDPHQLEILP